MALRALSATALLLALGAAAPKTSVIVFSPWSSSGLRPGFTVVARVKGSCWVNSLATDRRDAWRCMADDDIYDPCFTGPSDSLVACADDPFDKRVAMMTLKKPVAKSADSITHLLQPQGEPWGIRLSAGETCSFVTGATDVAQGMRMNYECRGNDFIAGFPNRSTSAWTVHVMVWPDRKHLKTVNVATAVF